MIYHDLPWFTMIYLFEIVMFHSHVEPKGNICQKTSEKLPIHRIWNNSATGEGGPSASPLSKAIWWKHHKRPRAEGPRFAPWKCLVAPEISFPSNRENNSDGELAKLGEIRRYAYLEHLWSNIKTWLRVETYFCSLKIGWFDFNDPWVI